MKSVNDHIDDLIITYLNDELEQDGREELKAWIASSPQNELYFKRKEEIWFSALQEKCATKYDGAKAFQRFQNRVAHNQNAHQKKGQFKLYMRYVACIAVLFLVSYFSHKSGELHQNDYMSDIVVETPLGSRTKFNLPDGTTVWLNAGSRMSYSKDFGQDNRQVELSGEGYFEVKQNEELPFFVKTKNLQLQVLGTKFNFRDYAEDVEAIVSLTKGKVSLSNLMATDNETILVPNKRAVLDKESGKMRVESVVASNAAEWVNGNLFFDEELLPDIVKKLERSYNMKIEIKNKALNSYRFYGNFARQEQNIEDVLEALSATQKLHYSIVGRQVTLY